MSKKKSAPAEAPASKAAPEASAPPAADPALAQLETAFAVGNNALVRKLAATSENAAVRAAAQALLPRVVPEPAQVLVGIAGLVVVIVAWMLTTHGP
jgi:hypothetical protein